MAMRAYNRCTARLIPLSWLQELGLQARRLCRLRRETAFSPESTAGSLEANFNGSCEGEVQIVGGILELSTD